MNHRRVMNHRATRAMMAVQGPAVVKTTGTVALRLQVGVALPLQVDVAALRLHVGAGEERHVVGLAAVARATPVELGGPEMCRMLLTNLLRRSPNRSARRWPETAASPERMPMQLLKRCSPTSAGRCQTPTYSSGRASRVW